MEKEAAAHHLEEELPVAGVEVLQVEALDYYKLRVVEHERPRAS